MDAGQAKGPCVFRVGWLAPAPRPIAARTQYPKFRGGLLALLLTDPPIPEPVTEGGPACGRPEDRASCAPWPPIARTTEHGQAGCPGPLR